MKRIVGVLVLTILMTGCTESDPGVNGPTPGLGVSERCAAVFDLYDSAKAHATEDPSKDAQAALEVAHEKLFNSGCLKS